MPRKSRWGSEWHGSAADCELQSQAGNDYSSYRCSSCGYSVQQRFSFASGMVAMGVAALLAVATAIVLFARTRHESDGERPTAASQ